MAVDAGTPLTRDQTSVALVAVFTSPGKLLRLSVPLGGKVASS
jgi:hypothetical protein